MFQKLFMLSTALASLVSNVQANVVTDDINKIAKEFDKLTEHDIAIFDCDDVLLFSPYFTNRTGLKILDLFDNFKVKLGNDNLAVKEMTSLIKITTTAVNYKMSKEIKKLLDRNVKVLVLTQSGAGSCGSIKSMSDFKIEQLHNYGYHFEKAWDSNLNISFPLDLKKVPYKMVIKTDPDTPQFKAGILFAGSYKKDEVLKHFLKEIKFSPTKILYIDDMAKNVDCIHEVAESIGARYKGIVYTAIEDFNNVSSKVKNLIQDTLKKFKKD